MEKDSDLLIEPIFIILFSLSLYFRPFIIKFSKSSDILLGSQSKTGNSLSIITLAFFSFK